MATNDQFAMTEEETKQRRMEAVYAHEEAKDQRAQLILEAKAIASRHSKLASILNAIEIEPEYPLQSEAALLTLSTRDYEGIGFESERRLANSIAASRKKVADAAEVRRIQRG
jgi:hypothetical protein